MGYGDDMQATVDRDAVSGAALDESAGISAPLYDVVDVLFQLQSRGFFRRQVQIWTFSKTPLESAVLINELVFCDLSSDPDLLPPR